MTLHELELVIREHFEPLETKLLSCAAWSSSTRRPTSYVAAALTLTLSLDRERDLKDRERDRKWTREGIKEFTDSENDSLPV